MHIVVNTDTEYEKKDANNHFGIKCQVIGYEWTSDPSEVSQVSQPSNETTQLHNP